MEKDMDNDMQISAREIEELIEGGIAFTKTGCSNLKSASRWRR